MIKTPARLHFAHQGALASLANRYEDLIEIHLIKVDREWITAGEPSGWGPNDLCASTASEARIYG